MASLMDRVTTSCVEDSKRTTFSEPRCCQRPCSTQKTGTVQRDFAAMTRSQASTRSCWPPLTMSPAWMKTSSSAETFSISSWFCDRVS